MCGLGLARLDGKAGQALTTPLYRLCLIDRDCRVVRQLADSSPARLMSGGQ